MPRRAGPAPLDDLTLLLPSPFDSPPPSPALLPSASVAESLGFAAAVRSLHRHAPPPPLTLSISSLAGSKPSFLGPDPKTPPKTPSSAALPAAVADENEPPMTSVPTPWPTTPSVLRLDTWSPGAGTGPPTPHLASPRRCCSPARRRAKTVSTTSSLNSQSSGRRRSSGSSPRPLRSTLTPLTTVTPIVDDRDDVSPSPTSSGGRSYFPPTAMFYRTNDDTDLPHATKMQMSDYLRRFEHLFAISPQRCRILVDAFIDTLEMGLKEDGHAVPMIPTWVFGWPKGDEKGPFLAVDLGGTNLRVCHVELEGEGKFGITQAKYRLTEEQKHEDGEKLFDFCAECLGKFIEDHYGDDEGNVNLESDLALGFTFSYPCTQKRIDHGELLRWTKGFSNPNTEGRDAAEMFANSLKKYKVPIKMTALINDTTGTLMASHYVDPTTRIGVIFGTGCNAAYMEKVSNIPKIKHLDLPPDDNMAINCEWGAFDSEHHEHLPRTKYDVLIDEQSNKPGQQAFEKMIAGLYLGEIFRIIVIEMVEEGVLFLGQNTYKMEKAYSFDTAFLSLIENDTTDELLTVTGLFTHFFGLDTTISERQFFRRLAQLIGTRAARLSAVGVAAIVSKQNLLEDGKEIGVATDGSLYNKYPKFPERMHEALVDIFGEKGKLIKSYHAEDGSGVGAAIIAAMTAERRQKGIHDHV